MTLTDRKAEVAKAFGDFMARRALGQPVQEHIGHLGSKLEELRKSIADLTKELNEATCAAEFIQSHYESVKTASGDGHASVVQVELSAPRPS